MAQLTDRGKKVMKSMVKTYGKEKAVQVFSAMVEEGKLKGVEKSKPKTIKLKK